MTEAGIVHYSEDSRFAWVPWLEKTGFPFHLKELLGSEIDSSHKLSSEPGVEEGGIRDPVLTGIINATKPLLQSCNELCSDTSSDRKMTHQHVSHHVAIQEPSPWPRKRGIAEHLPPFHLVS